MSSSTSSVSSQEPAALKLKIDTNADDYKNNFKVTSYFLSVISLIVGILVLAQVGALSNVPRVVGGLMLAVPAVLVMVSYIIDRFAKNFHPPIPSYDDLIAQNKELADILAEDDLANIHVTYHIGGATKTSTYSSLDADGRRMVLRNIRQTYTNQAGCGSINYSVKASFENVDTKQKREFTWNSPAGN